MAIAAGPIGIADSIGGAFTSEAPDCTSEVDMQRITVGQTARTIVQALGVRTLDVGGVAPSGIRSRPRRSTAGQS